MTAHDRLVRWGERLQAVIDFRAAAGAWPDKESPDPGVRTLGEWVNKQRRAVRQGRLSREQVEAMKTVGLDLAPAKRWAPKWRRRLAQVVAWHADHGRWPQPTSDDPRERRLGSWVAGQRTRRRDGRLDLQRESRLIAAGVPIGGRPGWDENFRALLAWREEHGRLPVRGEDVLAVWLHNQRRRWVRGLLAPERVEALTAAGIPKAAPTGAPAQQRNLDARA